MLCLVKWFQTAFNKQVEITILAISSEEAKYYDQNLCFSSMLCLMMWLQTAYNKLVEVTILAISSFKLLKRQDRQNTKIKSYVLALCYVW